MPFEDYLSAIVSPLLKQPEKFTIESTTDDMGVLLSLNLAQGDMGVVIGKSGETAKAIRHILRVFGMQNHARVNMKIVEPEGSPYRHKAPSDTELLA